MDPGDKHRATHAKQCRARVTDGLPEVTCCREVGHHGLHYARGSDGEVFGWWLPIDSDGQSARGAKAP